ncbi:ABC transporter ATP-binding protein [Odoribacter sp. Z80]|jgi:ABC-2 type transport system ATP-binding protein|uniref:ABC transporter ATP-binding protein n=1 Tax=Odoribacter sp. Z80 TaxID=2304575 RepID=UPI00137B1AD0|nr:ATP-binding cassette domain-containing protein [Odoribacter sp. Z80]NCE73031.1 ATP-binding cassette domain-containing protein [Odoribacter sp. Z80]
MSFFVAEHITKNYASHRALDDVSIEIPEGAIYGLLGPNGAGKTSLIRIITQITGPDSGQLFFKGKPLAISDMSRIGYLPEERGLYKKMKVGEQAVYLARLKGISRSEAIRQLKAWFEKFGIAAWWDKKVEELSKGMAQKVQFITTVLHQPEMLIFDEPFSGFDPINVELLKKEILELRQKGTTIIFSTHNMSSVEEICSHIALINKSHKIVEGPINEIREKYANNSYQLSIRPNDEIDVEELAGKEFEVLSNRTEGIRQDIVLQKLTDCPTNTLLSRFIGHTDILSYDKIIPSMHDIFIKLVKEQ